MANPISGEQVLNPSDGTVYRATDPVVSNVATPADFAAQYPTPLDPTEVIAMCEEVSLLTEIPDRPGSLKEELYREMNELEFTSGSSYIAFADGECPEEYQHDGDNMTVVLKNIGAKKSLTISDIKHSAAVAAANWHGINTLVGGFPGSEGLPGGEDMATFQRELVADLKEKEVRTGMTLVLNGEDRLLAAGDGASNALEFSGIEALVSGNCHTNDNSASGSFSAIAFDRFLSEACAIPQTLFGHSTAIQELMSAYFQLGYQGSQIVNFPSGDRITPGFNFGGFVNTAVGTLKVVSDNNFARTNIAGGNFQSNIYALRMTHNGEPLVYRRTQIPLSLIDLVPGCTAISFEIWKKTALIVKACCAQGRFTSQFTGRIVTTCPVIG